MPKFFTARIVRKDHDYSGDDDQDTAYEALAKGIEHLAPDDPAQSSLKALAAGAPWLYARERPDLYSVYQVTIPLGEEQEEQEEEDGRPMEVEHLFTGDWGQAWEVANAEDPRIYETP